MNNVYWMGGWAGRWTDKRRNLPTDPVNEVSQDLEPSRGADGTKNSFPPYKEEIAMLLGK